jgi:hypothetical protein
MVLAIEGSLASQRLADVRSGAHCGLKSDIAGSLKTARNGSEIVKGRTPTPLIVAKAVWNRV